ncbi:FMN-binding negative transcriptional regulator [Streptomyces sp. NPDC057638]|uniref:FMN-binding negative transcriptional regulator n=1 Tax=Streptomyces sp. NPDC057638 TaxID=3346190 RepID=UPI00368E8E0A
MFVPDVYQVADHTWPRRIIRGYPLATLASNGPLTPLATHVPVILPEEERKDTGSLVGVELIGHMNRSNPHWASLVDGAPARLLFHGPYGYVTPAVYETNPASPTWDFTSVHVNGRIRLVDDTEETLGIVAQTARTLEETFGDKWDVESSLEYFRTIVHGVGAFYLQVERVDSMFKLSQEKSPAIQERVIQRFEESDEGCHRSLATMMRGFGLGAAPEA